MRLAWTLLIIGIAFISNCKSTKTDSSQILDYTGDPLIGPHLGTGSAQAFMGRKLSFDPESLYYTDFVEDFGDVHCHQGGVMVGMDVGGDYSGRIQGACRQDFPLDENTKPHQLERISDGSNNLNEDYCRKGSFVEGFKCSGEDCSFVEMSCRPLLMKDGGEYAGKCQWYPDMKLTDYSPGGMRSGYPRKFRFPYGLALAGMRCQGKRCDDMIPYLCQLPVDRKFIHKEQNSSINASLEAEMGQRLPVDSPDIYYGKVITPNEASHCQSNGVITGLDVNGTDIAQIQVACDRSISLHQGDKFKWLPWITHRGGELNMSQCPKGWFVERINCAGKNCSDILMGCRPLAEGKYAPYEGRCRLRPDLKVHAGKKAKYRFRDRHALAGILCEGSSCKDLTPYLCDYPEAL